MKSWVSAVSLSFLYAFSSNASCPPISESAFNYKTLRSTIENCHLSTVGQVVAILPNSYRSNFTLMHQSQAIEEVLNPGTVTFLTPRTIMYGGLGKLVLSFTSNPKMPSFQEIQLFEYEDNKGFQFKQIKLYRQKAVFDENPTSCKNCHGTPAKPIWGFYDSWPGAYGTKDDVLYGDSAEYNRYQDFIKFLKIKPLQRFNNLIFPKDNFQRYQTGYGRQSNYTIRPNLGLSMLLNRLQARNLGNRFKNSNYYPILKDLMEWDLRGCSADDATLNSKLVSYIAKLNDEINREGTKLQSPIDASDFSGSRDSTFLMLMKTGLYKKEEFSMELNAKTEGLLPSYRSTLGEGKYSILTSLFYKAEFYSQLWDYFDPNASQEMTKEYLNQEDYKVIPFPSMHRMDLYSGYALYNKDPEACGKLLNKMILQGKKWKNAPASRFASSTIKSAVVAAPPSRISNPFQSCIYCHSGNDQEKLNIPFMNLSELKSALKINSDLSGMIFDKVKTGKMPKMEVLDDYEKESIFEFLKSVN